MKKIIRLTESDLVRLVKKVIKEQEENDFDFYMEELGELHNKIRWDGYQPEGDELEYFISEIDDIVSKSAKNPNLTEYDDLEIRQYANYIVKLLDNY